MSTRSDSYLSLCLEQASKSPLHYRHGCIIVRGGKVIGSGYNDNRSGFNGDALKTGRVANARLDGPALQDLKAKLKRKYKTKLDESFLQGKESETTFTPYEASGSAGGLGGGPHANTPLTMHSEMMAIQNALSASSTSACSAMSFEKPCWKLPTDSKRKLRLRRDVLKTYVEAVCAQAIAEQGASGQRQSTKQRSAKSQVQESQFEPRASQSGTAREREERNEREEEERGLQQRERSEPQQSGGAASVAECSIRPENNISKTDVLVIITTSLTSVTSINMRMSEKLLEIDWTRVHATTARRLESQLPMSTTLEHPQHRGPQKCKTQATPKKPPAQPTLIPTSQARNSTRNIRQRTKPTRLNGADLYVARIGNGRAMKKLLPERTTHPPSHTTSTSTPPSPTSGTGSLHDEFLNPSPAPSVSPPKTPDNSGTHQCIELSNVHASRPCYRCITYMHNVGIKRVFWTNADGKWEGSKVRELVDVLDGVGGDEVDGRSGSGRSGGGGVAGGGGGVGVEGKGGEGVKAPLGMFVTKHEVLMLRRVMGARAADPAAKAERKQKDEKAKKAAKGDGRAKRKGGR